MPKTYTDPAQGGLFLEIVEHVVVRDHVTDEGVFLSPPPGQGWRVLDARRERYTKWKRRRPIARQWGRP